MKWDPANMNPTEEWYFLIIRAAWLRTETKRGDQSRALAANNLRNARRRSSDSILGTCEVLGLYRPAVAVFELQKVSRGIANAMIRAGAPFSKPDAIKVIPCTCPKCLPTTSSF